MTWQEDCVLQDMGKAAFYVMWYRRAGVTRNQARVHDDGSQNIRLSRLPTVQLMWKSSSHDNSQQMEYSLTLRGPLSRIRDIRYLPRRQLSRYCDACVIRRRQLSRMRDRKEDIPDR